MWCFPNITNHLCGHDLTVANPYPNTSEGVAHSVRMPCKVLAHQFTQALLLSPFQVHFRCGLMRFVVLMWARWGVVDAVCAW